MTERRVTWLIGGLATALGLVFTVLITMQVQSADAMRRIGGPFAMTEMTGQPVTEADLRGKPTAMFFGYTHCPSYCPVTLQVMTNVLGRMGADADRVNVVFVTIDPDRDTPEVMRQYLGSFDPRIRGFVGTQAQLTAMASAYKVRYRRVPLAAGDYNMDHTVAVMLFDARGQFAGTVTSDDDEKAVQAKLEGMVGNASRTAGRLDAVGG